MTLASHARATRRLLCRTKEEIAIIAQPNVGVMNKLHTPTDRSSEEGLNRHTAREEGEAGWATTTAKWMYMKQAKIRESWEFRSVRCRTRACRSTQDVTQPRHTTQRQQHQAATYHVIETRGRTDHK